MERLLERTFSVRTAQQAYLRAIESDDPAYVAQVAYRLAVWGDRAHVEALRERLGDAASRVDALPSTPSGVAAAADAQPGEDAAERLGLLLGGQVRPPRKLTDDWVGRVCALAARQGRDAERLRRRYAVRRGGWYLDYGAECGPLPPQAVAYLRP